MIMLRSRQYIVELREAVYRIKGKTIDTIQKFESSAGDKFLICDFPGSISKVMLVDAPIKYAEAMAVRKLHEEGEFDEPVSIITHQKRRVGGRSTEIFFTAVTTKVYTQYLERIKEHDDTVILFPLNSVLFSLFKKLPTNKPSAVVFRHDTFADLIIGTHKRIFFTSRCTGFDSSQEQVSALWDMVARDISFVEEEHQVELDKVICINWVDTYSDEKVENQYLSYEPYKEELMNYENQPVPVSFPRVLKQISARKGVTKTPSLFLYYTRKMYPIAATLLLAAAIGLFSGYLNFDKKANALNITQKQITSRIQTLNRQISLKPLSKDFHDTYDFVNTLYYNKKAPSFKGVIHDIEQGLFPAAVLQNLTITYSDDQVNAEAYGTIDLGFENAYQGYQVLVKNLANKGYTIKTNDFNTQIDRNEFRLIFSRSIR